MFTRLIVGNFKAIRETTEIDLRPITLLFGPNAAGKSSVLHALHYLAELLRGGPRDAHKTQLSGGLLDLGGFDKLVHGHDPMGRITLGIEYDRASHPPEADDPQQSIITSDRWLSQGIDVLRKRIDAYRLTWTVGRSEVGGRPAVLAMDVDINHEPIATLVAGGVEGALSSTHRVTLNVRHPLLDGPIGDDAQFDARTIVNVWAEQVLGTVRDTADETLTLALSSAKGDALLQAALGGLPVEALPIAGKRFKVQRPVADVGRELKRLMRALETRQPGRRRRRTRAEKSATALSAVVNVLISEPYTHAADALAEFAHVGPLRDVTPRSDKFIARPIGESWYDGSKAWARLLARPDEPRSFVDAPSILREIVNRTLHDAGLFDLGITLEVVGERRFRDNRGVVETIAAQNEDLDEADREPVPPLEPFPKLFAGEIADAVMTSRDLRKALSAAADALPYQERLVLRDARRLIEFALQDVGVGVSQVIPALAAMLHITNETFRLVEQPELHLHPRAQTALGESAARRINMRHNFFPRHIVMMLETHSEHLLLRLLRRIRETSAGTLPEDSNARLTPEQLAVIYVEPTPDGARVRRLRIDERGEFLDRWPAGFFEERAEELFS